MKYTIRVNEVKNNERNIKGFATVVFSDSFKITNIAILENSDSKQLFVSMPRYKSNEKDENGSSIYKDVCNPITKEFREEFYENILDAFERIAEQEKDQIVIVDELSETPELKVTVTPYEREGSNIRGLARIYFEENFIVNNVNILQGKENVFIAMPSYKTRQLDEQGKAVYQDVCYPVTKEFRDKLYAEVIKTYEKEKEKQEKNVQKKLSDEKSCFQKQPEYFSKAEKDKNQNSSNSSKAPFR